MRNKLKILLVNPPYLKLSKGIKGSEWITPSLGLAYIAAMLKEHEIKILDMEQENKRIEDVLKEFGPDIVGLTATTPAANTAYEVMRKVKEINPKIITMMGGCHASIMPYEAIRQPGVDIVVKGEGELTVKEIVERISTNRSIKKIRGTIQKCGGQIISNPSRPLIADLDSLPFPARELLDYKNYRRPFTKGKRPITIMTSRGCPYRCKFCNKSIFGLRFRPRSAENVLREIEELVKQGYDDFHILDDTFNLDKDRAKKICQGIIDKHMKIYWHLPNGIRIDNFDEELARLMKRAGCYCVGFGIESGNQKTLDYIQKNLKISDVQKGLRIARKVGLEIIAFLIVGLPNETKEDIRNTVAFLKNVMVDAANFHILIPLPGTEIYNELKAKNLLLESNWSKYSFHNPPVYRTEHLTREDIFKEYKKAYRAYHISPRYILYRLWKMRSISQFRNNLKGLITMLKGFR